MTRPTVTPATGATIGTPASQSDRVVPHTVAMDDEPLLLVTSDVIRIAYGNALGGGSIGKIAFSANVPVHAV